MYRPAPRATLGDSQRDDDRDQTGPDQGARLPFDDCRPHEGREHGIRQLRDGERNEIPPPPERHDAKEVSRDVARQRELNGQRREDGPAPWDSMLVARESLTRDELPHERTAQVAPDGVREHASNEPPGPEECRRHPRPPRAHRYGHQRDAREEHEHR